MPQLKVLMVAPFHQDDGWGIASRDYAKALKSVDVDLSIRNIYLANSPTSYFDQEIIDLEKVNHDKYDVLIQQVIPNLLYYDGRCEQNISIHLLESQINNNNWLYRMTLMDKVLVTSNLEKQYLETRIKTPIFAIKEPVDISVYDKEYECKELDIFEKNTFKFLIVAEDNERKNIDAALMAYFQEFSVNDNVCLIIKTNRYIMPRIDSIRKKSRRYMSGTKYPSVFLIEQRLKREDLLYLHKTSSCLVVPSKGEAFCRPAVDSLGFNKPVIYTENIGIDDYCSHLCGWRVKSTPEKCWVEVPPIVDLYTANEMWQEPSISDLARCMREAYKNKKLYNLKCDSIKQSNILSSLSYESVGKNILKALNV